MSRVIKSSFYSTMENKKVIEFSQRKDHADEVEEGSAGVQHTATDEPSRVQAAAIIAEAEQKADEILADARRQAEQVVADAEQEINAWWAQKRQEDEEVRMMVQQQGYEQGMEQGREEGRRLVYEEYATALQQSAAILNEAPEVKRQMIKEAEPFVLDLAIEIAKKVIGDQLSLDKENVIDMIRKALARTQEYKAITVAVSPDVYPYVQENRAKLLEVLDSQVEMTVVPDESVADGGSVIRTTMGSVDARVDTQLEEIKKALQAALMDEGE